jgi:hypothetical protein
MPTKENRRSAVKRCLLGAAAAGLTFEHRPLMAKMMGMNPPAPDTSAGPMPMGRLGSLKVTRLICGGNLFSGFAHSGDLVYVSDVLKHYFHEDKILDTLQLCEQSGINSCILRTDAQMVKAINRYRKERGGRLQWIAQTYPRPENLKDNVKLAIDNGAVGAFLMGGNSQVLYSQGKVEQIGEVIAFMKQNKVVAGVGTHILAIPKAVEAMKIEPDFYFKTINSVGYEAENPAETAEYMRDMKKPWVGFKVLGAGRMKPRDGFDLAFRSGCDFINVGMYDFQVKENVALAAEIVKANSGRPRAWAV